MLADELAPGQAWSLPRNLYLAVRKCCACHAVHTLRNLRAAVPMPYKRRSRGGLRIVRQPNSHSFLHLAIPHLAKVRRLPRNLYLTLRKCCACHTMHTLRNLRAAVPLVPSPRPIRTRSETASVQASRPRWFAHCPEAQFTHNANVSASCHPPALLVSAFIVAFFAHIHLSS